MTSKEFNETYAPYLEQGCTGLDLTNERVIDFLDKIFACGLIHIPNFTYRTITYKMSGFWFGSNLPDLLGFFGNDMEAQIERRMQFISDGTKNDN